MLQPLFSIDRAYGAPGRIPRRARRYPSLFGSQKAGKALFGFRKGSLALTTTQGWAFRRVKRGGSAWICPGRPFLALPWAGRACPPGKHSLRYPDTPWRSQAKAGRSLSQARTHGDGKASRLGPRFEARARGQGQREPVQSAASASLQTSKQLLAYSSSDRKQKPGRLALFGRPRFVVLDPVAFHPLV